MTYLMVVTALHYDSYTEARTHLKELLDAAEQGRPASVRRDASTAMAVDANRLRRFLLDVYPSRAQVVAEAGGWSVFIPGLPLAADGASFDEAITEMIDALREYADDWQDHPLQRAEPQRQLEAGPPHRAQQRRPAPSVADRAFLMTWPQATREDYERFCLAEGWRQVRDAKGRTGTHHVTYELALPDGQVLRTRISHPPDRISYGDSLWGHILRDQLKATQEAFRACVRDGTLPDRGLPAAPPGALPADLVHLLLTRAGLTEEEIRPLTKPEAIARLQRYWTEGA